jgi:rhodanese-related sulfurtransferase
VKSLIVLIIIILSSIIISCNKSNNTQLKTSISVIDFKNKVDNNEILNIIDVRSEGEYLGPIGNIPNSQLVPLPSIANFLNDLKNLDGEVYVVCLSGKRSSIAAKLLRANNINALNIEGGMLAWNKLSQ